MSTITITQSLAAAATAVHLDRRLADEKFGQGLFDEAVQHHTARRLHANLKTGTVSDRDGWRSRYVNPSHYAGAKSFDGAEHLTWFEFFRGAVMNSASRLSRGLGA
jgi:hypothetical protein